MEKTTKMSRAIMPFMTNQRGVLFGGKLLEWMDEVSGITAKRFAQSEVATVAVERVRFLKPIPLGSFLDVIGEVKEVGNTSIRVEIRAVIDTLSSAEPTPDGDLAADAVFVYVALDNNGRPRKVDRKP